MPAVTVQQAFELALEHHQAGRLGEAEGIYREILAVQPEHADAMQFLGILAHQTGRHDLAVELISRVVSRDPKNTAAQSNLGEVLRATGRLDEAVAAYERALAIEPNMAELHNNFGNVLRDKGQYEASVFHFRNALSLKPSYADAHKNLAYTFIEMDRWDDAIASCEQALELQPDLAEAYLNLGAAQMGKCNVDQAENCFRRAIDCKGDYVDAHWNRGVALMLGGRYEEGWKEFEWRRRTTIGRRSDGFPSHTRGRQWDGSPAPGETILIYWEEGYGDTIQFVRYLHCVAERVQALRVIFVCPKPLARLMKESGGWKAEIFLQDKWDEADFPEFDRYSSLLSLPLALGSFRPDYATAYFRVGAELRDVWRRRLGPERKFRIGIAWTGSRTHADDRHRSVDPSMLMDLTGIPGVDVLSLQKEFAGKAPESLVGAGLIDHTEHIEDFADTAGLMMELDLVITVDTAVAHLAGALGKRVWTLLPFVPDWRWGLGREDSPWYPTMRLFRQPSPGDWESVIGRVVGELKGELVVGTLRSRNGDGGLGIGD